MYELEDWEEFCEMLSSGHDTGVPHMNSQQVWLPVLDLHTMEPVNIPAGQGGATSEEVIGS